MAKDGSAASTFGDYVSVQVFDGVRVMKAKAAKCQIERVKVAAQAPVQRHQTKYHFDPSMYVDASAHDGGFHHTEVVTGSGGYFHTARSTAGYDIASIGATRGSTKTLAKK